jgi:membrane associated rhomboid family serine protease/Zn-finger nucleic acid-binding protein
MRCPVCSSELRSVKSKSEIVSVCPGCNGIWSDAGEFVNLVSQLAKSEVITPEIPQLFKPRQVQPAGKIEEEPRMCPRCNAEMRKLNYAYDSNVFLDKCPNCGGIWTDGGEIVQIVRYLKNDPRMVAIGEQLVKSNQTLDDLEAFGESLEHTGPPFLFLTAGIPISDDTPRQRIPVVTISIVTLCTLIFVAQVTVLRDWESILVVLGYIPARLLDVSLVTSMFIHAGILHLLGNMLFLWIFGDNIEDRFGRLGFSVFYVSCGLVASILYGVFNLGSPTPVVGASGAISGIMGAYCILFPRARIRLLVISTTIHVPAAFYLGFWFLIQVANGLLYHSVGLSNIAWFAHIGGFIFGAIVGYLKKEAPADKQD